MRKTGLIVRILHGKRWCAVVRGEGPLRPEKARSLGYSGNTSALFRTFRAFRRTSPHSKTAGAYARILVVKDNDRAAEMASDFHEGRPEYEDDTKWWELVEEADRELLYGTGKGKSDDVKSDGNGLPDGLLDDDKPTGGVAEEELRSKEVSPSISTRREVPSFSRKFTHADSGATWNVVAFEVEPADPDLPTAAPWGLPLADVATRTYHFLYRPEHSVFRSITMTPRDALLTHLAWMTADILRTSSHTPDLAVILEELRRDYGDDALLDPKGLGADASDILIDLAKTLVANIPEEDRAALVQRPAGRRSAIW